MKLNVLLLLAVVLLPYVSCQGGEGTCDYGERDVPVGERVYDFESNNGIAKCIVAECTAVPFLGIDRTDVQCSKVSDNCSVPSTPHERNLSICCQHCSECDFVACPENSVCVKNGQALCQCLPEYEENMVDGQLICVDLNECANDKDDCPAHSDCVDILGGFNCSCHPGYSGDACTDIDECEEISDICPSNSQCVNHDGFYECVCNDECLLDINSYYLTPPNDPANFSVHNQGCSPMDHNSFPGQQSIVICTGQQQVLTDGFTEASIPPAPNQYVGWDRNQGDLDGFTIVIDSDHTRLTRLDIRFYHNPSAGIGLPEVSSVYVSPSKASNAFTGPLSFDYARNEDLTQSDNRMRTVSIIITPDNLGGIGFYQFVMVNFTYSSSTIERAQLVEIWGYGGTGSIVKEKEITFSSGSNNVVRLEADEVVSKVDLSCTVANPGAFLWEWTRASDGAVLTSNANLADLTRTSILTIDKLSIEDSGDYVCRAFQGNASSALEAAATIVLDLAYDVVKDKPSEYVSQSEATITCEFFGYFPKGGRNVQWDFEGRALDDDGGKYTIVRGPGNKGLSQNGRHFVGLSLISSLTISSLEESDKGIYGCRVVGDSCLQLIGYIQISDVATASSAESCSNEEPTDTNIWLYLFLLELLIIAVMILVIGILICFFCCKHRYGNLNVNKEKVCSSPECKVPDMPDNKYVVEVPLYDVITAPADYEVVRAPASYEVIHSPDSTDKKESE